MKIHLRADEANGTHTRSTVFMDGGNYGQLWWKMTYRFLSFYIPERMEDGIRRYIDERVRPGDFLQAVISNNLKEAVWRADEENINNLPAYVSYFYNEAPSNCWGSKEKMENWIGGYND